MSAASSQAAPKVDVPRRNWKVWVGRGISVLPVLGLVMSASMKLSHAPQVVEMFTSKFGYQESSLMGIGLLELAVAVLYVIPRTAVLGAVLVTAYLGGAVATHVRVGDPFITPVILGVLVWIGLYLREPRLHALAPLRSS